MSVLYAPPFPLVSDEQLIVYCRPLAPSIISPLLQGAGSDEGVGWSVAPPLVSDDSDVVEEIVDAAVCTAPGRAATW